MITHSRKDRKQVMKLRILGSEDMTLCSGPHGKLLISHREKPSSSWRSDWVQGPELGVESKSRAPVPSARLPRLLWHMWSLCARLGPAGDRARGKEAPAGACTHSLLPTPQHCPQHPHARQDSQVASHMEGTALRPTEQGGSICRGPFPEPN